ncbi:hypothetical protein RhiirC2_796845 [Rhizophagus irregularis]|uniref:Uncharacterized protein n=1 Tax=Rhizophagus irregularis TaxID=588596 RepID=A0A2N1M8Z3_9GLOM|nr:hypothetical protein RhiirC2_796845 [Rhizophagus irregularis]
MSKTGFGQSKIVQLKKPIGQVQNPTLRIEKGTVIKSEAQLSSRAGWITGHLYNLSYVIL